MFSVILFYYIIINNNHNNTCCYCYIGHPKKSIGSIVGYRKSIGKCNPSELMYNNLVSHLVGIINILISLTVLAFPKLSF